MADSWYAEGGTAALAQAEIEYNDFKTFFPNMPEAAEAQLKIANIHYQQMEKPDRDYTHAMRAEEEYRNLILQFPDSKTGAGGQAASAGSAGSAGGARVRRRALLLSAAILSRGHCPACALVDKYPLYSKADEALLPAGAVLRSRVTIATACAPSCRAKRDGQSPHDRGFHQDAADAYSHILTRYPLMDRADDAKARLIALHQPVPRPTEAALAQNKAEEDSRHETGTVAKVLRNFRSIPMWRRRSTWVSPRWWIRSR